jgi:hypothetical protein
MWALVARHNQSNNLILVMAIFLVKNMLNILIICHCCILIPSKDISYHVTGINRSCLKGQNFTGTPESQ